MKKLRIRWFRSQSQHWFARLGPLTLQAGPGGYWAVYLRLSFAVAGHGVRLPIPIDTCKEPEPTIREAKRVAARVGFGVCLLLKKELKGEGCPV